MKKLIKVACTVGILWGCLTPLYANTAAKNKIFPTYTGITAQVVGTQINVRSYPSKYGEVLMSVSKEDLQILGQNDNWYRVKVKGEEGWVSKDYVEAPEESFIPYSKVLGEEIVDYGKLFIGTPRSEERRVGKEC